MWTVGGGREREVKRQQGPRVYTPWGLPKGFQVLKLMGTGEPEGKALYRDMKVLCFSEISLRRTQRSSASEGDFPLSDCQEASASAKVTSETKAAVLKGSWTVRCSPVTQTDCLGSQLKPWRGLSTRRSRVGTWSRTTSEGRCLGKLLVGRLDT